MNTRSRRAVSMLVWLLAGMLRLVTALITRSRCAVLIWPDIFGLRPAMRSMGKRLAGSGYSVLVVNPFYRVGKPTATGATTNR